MEPLHLLSLSAGLLIASLVIVLYRRFPVHLIYRSKIGLQDMFDGISDPLAVITADCAYMLLVNRTFPDIINEKCYELLRGRTTPCKDCLLQKAIAEKKALTLARTELPDEHRVLSISFSPFNLVHGGNEFGITEHLRDITLLEKLKHDLEKKNRSLAFFPHDD